MKVFSDRATSGLFQKHLKAGTLMTCKTNVQLSLQYSAEFIPLHAKLASVTLVTTLYFSTAEDCGLHFEIVSSNDETTRGFVELIQKPIAEVYNTNVISVHAKIHYKEASEL